MRRFLFSSASIGTLSLMIAGFSMAPTSKAFAGPTADQGGDDLGSINREIAKLRAENEALRQRDRLRQENSALRERDLLREENAVLRDQGSRRPQQSATAREPIIITPTPTAVPVPVPVPYPVQAQQPAAVADRLSDSANPLTLLDYAGGTTTSLSYKAPPLVTPGLLTFWGEGGATWAGGDPVYNTYPTLLGGSGGFLSLLGGGAGLPGYFSFVPHLGWEAAGGFDYRFPNSPWHVSGQFRYGDNRVSASPPPSAGSIAIPSGGTTVRIGTSASATGSDDETHWLADFTVGRDYGIGQSTVQFKGGLRLADLTASSTAKSNSKLSLSGLSPIATIFGGTTTSIAITSAATRSVTSQFLGAGPVFGAQGRVPVWGSWTFDYTADAALLFGQLKDETKANAVFGLSPIALTIGYIGFGLGGNSPPTATSKSVLVVNPDLQAGFSYWVTPKIAISASYRIDAFLGAIMAVDTAGNLIRSNRYYHGPRLGVSGAF